MKIMHALTMATMLAFLAVNASAAGVKNNHGTIRASKTETIKSEKYPDGALFVVRHFVDVARLAGTMTDAEAEKFVQKGLTTLTMPENIVICLENGVKCYDKVSYAVALRIADEALDINREIISAIRELMRNAPQTEKQHLEALLQKSLKVREIATYWKKTLKAAGPR